MVQNAKGDLLAPLTSQGLAEGTYRRKGDRRETVCLVRFRLVCKTMLRIQLAPILKDNDEEEACKVLSMLGSGAVRSPLQLSSIRGDSPCCTQTRCNKCLCAAQEYACMNHVGMRTLYAYKSSQTVATPHTHAQAGCQTQGAK